MALTPVSETHQLPGITESSPEDVIDWLRSWRTPLAQAHEALLFPFVPPDDEVRRDQLVAFVHAAVDYGQALTWLQNNRPQDASHIIATVVSEHADIAGAVASEARLVAVGQSLNLALNPRTPEDISFQAIPKQYFLDLAASYQLYGKLAAAKQARQVAAAITTACVWPG